MYELPPPPLLVLARSVEHPLTPEMERVWKALRILAALDVGLCHAEYSKDDDTLLVHMAPGVEWPEGIPVEVYGLEVRQTFVEHPPGAKWG